ncbi:hypothetical protein BDR07DRAFT_1262935, partial [Suillus spraguei]
TVIQTSYDQKHRSNVHFPAKTNRRENIIWTEGEQAKAEAGEVVKDIDDLHSKLDNLYIDGCRAKDRYLHIPMSILQGGRLDLCNSDGSLMAFVCSSLPDDIHYGLASNLLVCFDGKKKLTEKTLSHPFQCLHFSLWNQYSTTGAGAPTHIHPHEMARVGVSRTNHTQCLSHSLKDILEHQQVYNNVLATFSKLFEWLEHVMKTHLPEEYEVIVELSQNLPGRECSQVAPFLSIVINLNVTIEAH